MDRMAVEAHIHASKEPKFQEAKSEDWEEYLQRKTAHLNVQYNADESLAEFTVTGVMWKGASPEEEYFYGVYNTDRIQRNMMEIAGRSAVRDVVINFDTPGGMARGTKEAAESIAKYRKDTSKMVFAWVPNLCASAGYYCAAACSRIDAHPSALVGSIGTMAVAVDSSGLFQKMGYDITLYTGGADLKGMGSTGVEWTKAWHEKLKSDVEELRAEFVSFVKANRPGITEASFRGDAFEAKKAPVGMVDSA